MAGWGWEVEGEGADWDSREGPPRAVMAVGRGLLTWGRLCVVEI